MKLALSKESEYVLLIALSFWIWLAKDMVFKILGLAISRGQLILVTVVVISLLVISSFKRFRIYNSHFKLIDFRYTILFLTYCYLSALTTGFTPFTVFKLESLLISILVAYLLAPKIISAIRLNRSLVLAVGIVIGTLGSITIFGNVLDDIQSDAIGLRVLRIAHLNIQDYYVVLIMMATSALFLRGNDRRDTYLLLIVITISLPIIIGINSRMIPMTVGGSLILAVIKYRKSIMRLRTALTLIVVTITLGFGLQLYGEMIINQDSRLFSAYDKDFISIWRNDPRSASFAKAINDFTLFPIFGVGFGKYSLNSIFSGMSARTAGTWPHNLFLELLSELGIVGLVLFIFQANYRGGHLGGKRWKNQVHPFPYIILFYALLTLQLTHNLYYPLLWLALAMVHALHIYPYLRKEH